MKKILWIALLVTPYIYAPAWGAGVVVETTVQAAAQAAAQPPWEAAATFPSKEEVFSAHDRFPGLHGDRERGDRDVGTAPNDPNENECSEPPDGGQDCDDVVRGVAEPGPLGLAVLGLAGLGWVWSRRRK